MHKLIIAPSLLSADFMNLKEEIGLVEKNENVWIHYDVMDGHFVPNISFGPKILKDIKKQTSLFLDVHLMITNPTKFTIDFINAGADMITFHYEIYNDTDMVYEAINQLKKLGVKVGVSIKPNTPVEHILSLVKHLDLVLIMSVEPGFGGQKFMESSLNKIKILHKYITDNHLNCLIEVDGGIDDVTGPKCIAEGCDVLVAGSYLFGHDDFQERLEKLRK